MGMRYIDIKDSIVDMGLSLIEQGYVPGNPCSFSFPPSPPTPPLLSLSGIGRRCTARTETIHVERSPGERPGSTTFSAIANIGNPPSSANGSG